MQESVLHTASKNQPRTAGPHWGPATTTAWRCALELNENRLLVSGSELELASAIRRGADLRVGTGFRHHEHIEVGSSCRELIHEFIDFRVTYLLDNHWTAGICNLRMPVQLPNGFGPRESMSFFMYNQDGQQAIARPHFDIGSAAMEASATRNVECGPDSFANMLRYKELDRWDDHTNSPSQNFVYDFDFYRYCVSDRWREVFSHDADGRVQDGSLEDLILSFSSGAELKVAIRGLCDDLALDATDAVDHEVFVHLGSCYYYTERKLLIGATHPVVRVAPAMPIVYRSKGWDFGWLLPRTDGYLARWLCDPYTYKFHQSFSRHAMRWFVGV